MVATTKTKAASKKHPTTKKRGKGPQPNRPAVEATPASTSETAPAAVETISFGGKTYTCPYSGLFRPHTRDEDARLRASIGVHKIHHPVVVTDEDEILDGMHRLRIAAELGLDPADVPITVLAGLDPEAKLAKAKSLNVDRRHLTREELRAAIAVELVADPTRSNKVIADEVGVDDKTVAKERGRLEGTADIPRLTVTRGRDGKGRPARRPAAVPKSTPAADEELPPIPQADEEEQPPVPQADGDPAVPMPVENEDPADQPAAPPPARTRLTPIVERLGQARDALAAVEREYGADPPPQKLMDISAQVSKLVVELTQVAASLPVRRDPAAVA